MQSRLEGPGAEAPDPAVTATLLAAALVWGAAVSLAAARGAIRELYMPAIALLVAAGIAMPTLAYFALEPLRRYFRTLGLYPLTILHLWRIPAAFAFFAYGAAAALPPLFWILAGVGDLIAGCYAGRLLFARGDEAYYRRFHAFGFGDFVVAVGTGLAFTLLQDPRMAAITELPMVLIPLFGVGISGASHLIAFDLLRRRGSPPR
jgi:hypothetical protein